MENPDSHPGKVRIWKPQSDGKFEECETLTMEIREGSSLDWYFAENRHPFLIVGTHNWKMFVYKLVRKNGQPGWETWGEFELKGGATSVRVAPDRSHFAVAHAEGGGELWRCRKTGIDRIGFWRPEKKEDDYSPPIVWGHRGKVLFIGGRDGTVYLLGVPGPKRPGEEEDVELNVLGSLRPLREEQPDGKRGDVNGLVWSIDFLVVEEEAWLAVSYSDGTVRIWRCPNPD